MMVFTKNESVGFKSMQECLNFYEFQNYAEEDYKFKNKFDIDEQKYADLYFATHHHNESMKNKKYSKEVVKGFREQHIFELKHFYFLEDQFDCSGVCQPALFYFTKQLHEGPPKQTCLVKIKD